MGKGRCGACGEYFFLYTVRKIGVLKYSYLPVYVWLLLTGLVGLELIWFIIFVMFDSSFFHLVYFTLEFQSRAVYSGSRLRAFSSILQ